MNYFGMTYNEVLNSPFQRLLMLAKSIPKYNDKKDEVIEKEPTNFFDKVRGLGFKTERKGI